MYIFGYAWIFLKMTLCDGRKMTSHSFIVQRNLIDKQIMSNVQEVYMVPQYAPLHCGGSQVILVQRNVFDIRFCPMYRMFTWFLGTHHYTAEDHKSFLYKDT
jgi:hypothetical protein